MLSALVSSSLSKGIDCSKEIGHLHTLPRYLTIELHPQSWAPLLKLFPEASRGVEGLRLKLSLWHTAEERISEDIFFEFPHTDSSSNHEKPYLLIFPVASIPVTNDLTDKLYERSVFLFIEMMDYHVGIPYFVGSLRLAITSIMKQQSPQVPTAINSIELCYGGKALTVAVSLKVNSDVLGYTEWLNAQKLITNGSINVDLTLALCSTLSPLSYRTIASLNKDYKDLGEYLWIRSYPQRLIDVMEEMYLPTDRIHISVDDLQINKDMMDFYAGNMLAVRVCNLSEEDNKQFLYLGHVLDMNCTWLEVNELSTITPCEGLQVEVVIFSVKEEGGRSTIEENVISAGKLSNLDMLPVENLNFKSKLSANSQRSPSQSNTYQPTTPQFGTLGTGMYQIPLFTEIQSMYGSNTFQSIKVGNIKIKIDVENIQDCNYNDSNNGGNTITTQGRSIPAKHTLNDLRQLYQSMERKEQEYIILEQHSGIERIRESHSYMTELCQILLSCSVGLVTSYRQENELLPQSYEHFFALFDRILNLMIKVYYTRSNRYEGDMITLLERLWNLLMLSCIQYNVEESFLIALHIYFQEWLTSDSLQSLLALNNADSIDVSLLFAKDLLNDSFCEQEEERIHSLLKAVHMIVWTRKLLQRYDVEKWQTNQNEEFDAIQKDLEITAPMDMSFMEEIQEELATIFLQYRILLVEQMQSYHPHQKLSNGIYFQHLELLQHASLISTLLHYQPSLLQKTLISLHQQYLKEYLTFLVPSLKIDSIIKSTGLSQSFRILRLIFIAWQQFIMEVYQIVAGLSQYNGKHAYLASNPLSTAMEKIIPFCKLLQQGIESSIKFSKWIEVYSQLELAQLSSAGYSSLLITRLVDMSIYIYVINIHVYSIYEFDMNLSNSNEIIQVAHVSLVDDMEELRQPNNNFFPKPDEGLESTYNIPTPKNPQKRVFFPAEADETAKVVKAGTNSSVKPSLRNPSQTPSKTQSEFLSQSIITPRRKDQSTDGTMFQFPATKNKLMSWESDDINIEQEPKTPIAKVAEIEYRELTGTLLLYYIHQTSFVTSLFYSSVLFSQTSNHFLRSNFPCSLDVQSFVQKLLDLYKSWMFTVLSVVVNDSNITPKMLRKSIYGYYYNNVENEIMRKGIKYGVVQLLTYATVMDKLYTSFAQDYLHEIQVKIREGLSKNQQEVIKCLREKHFLHLCDRLRKTLSYLYAVPTVLYDLNLMRDFLSADAMNQSDNFGKGSKILSIEVEDVGAGYDHIDGSIDSLLHSQRTYLTIGTNQYIQRLPSVCTIIDRSDLINIASLRFHALDSITSIFQCFWLYLHIQFVVVNQASKSSTQVSKDQLCRLIEELILTLSSMEAAISIYHAILGFGTLRKGERTVASSTQTMTRINPYSEELFSVAYLQNCLQQQFFQTFAICFSQLQPSPVSQAPASNHILYEKVEDIIENIVQSDSIQIEERIESIKMAIFCSLMENIYLIPFTYPPNVTDTLPVTRSAIHSPSKEDEDTACNWRYKRSKILREDFVQYVHISLKFHLEKSFSTVPVATGASSLPVSPLMLILPFMPSIYSIRINEMLLQHSQSRFHPIAHYDICIHELMQYLLVFHHQNVNHIEEVSYLYQQLVTKTLAFNCLGLKPTDKSMDGSIMKAPFGKLLKLHGVTTLLLDSFLNSLQHETRSVAVTNQIIPNMKKIIEDHFEFKDLTSSSKIQVTNPTNPTSNSTAIVEPPFWETFVHNTDVNSTSGFIMLLLFLLEFQHNHILQRDQIEADTLISSSTPNNKSVIPVGTTVVKKEKELQYFRDALTLFLHSGHWEIGLHLTELYKDIMKQSQDMWSIPASTRSGLSQSGTIVTSSPLRTGVKSLFSPKKLPPSTPLSAVSMMSSTPATSNSPKRTETIQNELKRVMQKFQEKLKLDGDIRLPTRYLAIRLLSTSPLSLDKNVKLAQLHGVAISHIHSVNWNNTTHAATSPLSRLPNVSASSSSTSYPWYEQWMILRFDMASTIACMHYYQDHLDVNQHLRKSDPLLKYIPPDLSYPLAFLNIIKQLRLIFPEFQLISTDQDVSQQLSNFSTMFQFGFPNSQGFGGSTLNFMQCFTAFDAQICDEVYDPNTFIHSADRGNHESKGYLNVEEDEDGNNSDDGLQKEESNYADDIIRSNDLDELFKINSSTNSATKSIKKHLDRKFLKFESFPSNFYVFMAPGNPHVPNSDSTAQARGIQRILLSTYNRQLPITKILEPTQQFGFNLNVVAFSPVSCVIQTSSQRLTLVESSSQVLLHIMVALDRMVKALEHINALKATELSNQPHESIFHTDNIFFQTYDALVSFLSQPAQGCCIGLHNVDFVLTYETERNEVRWQTMRKHAKREYMRQLSEYEESTSQKNAKGDSMYSKSGKTLRRPDEPDLKSMKETFDTEAGLDTLNHLQLLRDGAMKRIVQCIKLMKQFIEKIINNKVPTTGTVEARQQVRMKGRMSISLLEQVRNNQWGQHLEDTVNGEEEEQTVPIDDEVSLKQKCCLHLEALLAAIEMGVAL